MCLVTKKDQMSAILPSIGAACKNLISGDVFKTESKPYDALTSCYLCNADLDSGSYFGVVRSYCSSCIAHGATL